MADRVETIGIYSAYGFAKEAGYTGTKAEFEQGLKNSAEYAGNAAASAASANNAKTAAQNAQNAASQSAESAANSASAASQSAEKAAASAAALTIDKTLSQENVAADSKAVGEALNRKADVDGFYEEMSVGTAEQLNSTQKVQDSEPYLFRTSGGSADIGNREELTIVGGSVVWNQIIKDNFSPLALQHATKTIANGEVTVASNSDNEYVKGLVVEGTCLINHVIFISAYLKTDENSEAAVGFRKSGVNISAGYSGMEWTNSTSYVYMARIAKSDSAFAGGLFLRNNTPSGGSATFKNVQLFDLTQMFGSEIADYIYGLEQAEAGAGVAWFRKYFPNDYYEYNAGELLSVNDLQSHDTVGFNLLEEDIVVGYYYDNSGNYIKKNSNYAAYPKTIKVIPNTEYCISFPLLSVASAIYIFVFDENNNLLYSTNYINILDATRRVLYTMPSNAKYMTFFLYSAATYTNEYFNNACVNFSWSGGRDGEYEPYKKHSYPLDSSLTLRGVPKLDSNNNLYFDGDTYDPDGTVTRKYGIVDLGTLGWRYNETHSMFYATLSGTQPFFNFNGICSKYVRTKSANGSPSSGNTEWGSSAFIGSGFNLLIRDSAYTDAATFKAAMSGVMLVYELAEPTTEEAAPYTSPQIVDDWGTEEFVTSSIVPVGHNTSYPANLRDKLQHLPSLPDSDGYYMTQVTGTQMGLVRFRIPQAPATDGTYVLKATVSNGTPTYTWVDENAEEVTEP